MPAAKIPRLALFSAQENRRLPFMLPDRRGRSPACQDSLDMKRGSPRLERQIRGRILPEVELTECDFPDI